MLLKLYLEQLSPSILKKILEEHKLNINSKAPNEIVDALDEWLINYDNLDKIYNSMTREEKEVLSYFILQIPDEPLAYRKLHNLNGEISRTKFEEGINKLKKKGIIYLLEKEWANIYFVIPENLFLIWHKYFTYELIINQKEESVLNSVEKNKPNDLLEEDLYRFLVFLQLEIKSIYKEKNISKKYINKITNRLEIENSSISSFPIRKNINLANLEKSDLKNIYLLFTIADTLELIDLSKEIISAERIAKWHNANSIGRRYILEQIICSCFKSSDLLIQHIFYFLFNLPKNKWFSFTKIASDLSRLLNRPIAQEILIRAEKEIINSLYAFGWIQKYDDSEQVFFKWIETENGETKYFYVQPNYELLVPYTFPHNLRLIIEKISKLDKYDYINKYVISRDTILNGLESGLLKEDIINFLESYSANPIDENIMKAISDWSNSYGLISFLDVRIMKCSSESIAKDIKNQKRFEKWIIGEIDSKNLIIRKSNFDELIKELNSQGIYPEKKIWSELNTINNVPINNTWEELDNNNIFRYRGFSIVNSF